MIGPMWSQGRWIACVLLTVLSAACGSADDGAGQNPGVLYPDRANQYREDQERRIGEPVMIGGYTATVTEADFDSESASIRVGLEITNRDQKPQRVDATQWTLVNPRVQTLEAARATFLTTELAGGATTAAVVWFTVDSRETGAYYIQYKPELLDAARGIWRVTVD
jgi:hypothetical protein